MKNIIKLLEKFTGKKQCFIFLIMFFMSTRTIAMNRKKNSRHITKTMLENTIKETIFDHGLYSESAVNLILGTASQESHLGRVLGKNLAISMFQIEPRTFYWLKKKYGKKYGFNYRYFNDLKDDLKLAVLVCRLRYYVVVEPLPDADNIQALAEYWKMYYNTYRGKGRINDFLRNYKKYIIDGR